MILDERSGSLRPVIWLCIGFALTGAGTTLLGCILPTLSTLWHLDDHRAGTLFAAQFTGSTLGALLVRSNFFRSLVRGYLLLISSAVFVAFSSGLAEGVLLFAFGLGLGLTMTSTSMVIGSAFVRSRGAALSLLNACWGVGAAVTPALAALWVGRHSPTYLYVVLASAVTVTLLLIGADHATLLFALNRPTQNGDAFRNVKLVYIFAILGFLYVGTEVSVSGWMMSYVGRLPLSNRAWAPVATSSFWVALICGRALVAAVLRWLSEIQLLTLSLTIAFIAVLLLVLSHTPIAVVLSSTLTGLALGPVYPLCLAQVLRLMHDSQQSKWVFAISGLGGAVLPWITGALSAHSSSLRVGLLIPLFALSVMVLLDWLGSSRRVSFQESIY